MNCFSEIFLSSLSQQKLMRKKFFCCKKILLILNNQKMKNLQNLNLVELNAQEIMKIEGGAWPKWVKGGLIGYIASELIDNWDDFEKGFSSGYNAASKK